MDQYGIAFEAIIFLFVFSVAVGTLQGNKTGYMKSFALFLSLQKYTLIIK